MSAIPVLIATVERYLHWLHSGGYHSSAVNDCQQCAADRELVFQARAELADRPKVEQRIDGQVAKLERWWDAELEKLRARVEAASAQSGYLLAKPEDVDARIAQATEAMHAAIREVVREELAARANENTGDVAGPGSASGSSPAPQSTSPVSPASEPLKVAPSFGVKGDYTVWCGISGIATFHGPDAKANAEAFVASRAPRASFESTDKRFDLLERLLSEAGYKPDSTISKCVAELRASTPRASTVSVEEMAERLAVAHSAHFKFGPVEWASVSETAKRKWHALAKAALSALPAPDEKPLAPAQRVKPCGCVVCVCPGDERCYGCGARSCDEHNPSVQRKRLEEHLPAPDATKPASGLPGPSARVLRSALAHLDEAREDLSALAEELPPASEARLDAALREAGSALLHGEVSLEVSAEQVASVDPARVERVKAGVLERAASEAQGEANFAQVNLGDEDRDPRSGSPLGSGAEGTGSNPVGGTHPKPASEAQGEPTLEDCWVKFTDFSMGALEDPKVSHNEAYKCGVAAVRTLCLSRAPSPALAAIVEAAERWAGQDGCDLIKLHHDGKLADSGYSDNVKRLVPLIVEARAALPKGGAA